MQLTIVDTRTITARKVTFPNCVRCSSGVKMHDILQSVRGAKIKIGLFRVQYCLDCAFLQKLQFLAIRMREKRRKIRNSAFEAMQKRKFTKNVIFCCSRGEYESNSTWKCLYFMCWVVIMMNAPHFSLRRLEKNSHFRSEMWSIYIVDVVWIVSIVPLLQKCICGVISTCTKLIIFS